MNRILSMITLFVLMVVPVSATIINIPGDYPTIQAGIDAASDGDTVLVSVGTYVENINFQGKNIVVIGEDRETTIIDGNQSGSVVKFDVGLDSTTVLDGFTITNGLGNGTQNENEGGGIIGHSAITLKNLIVKNNYAHYGGGISFNDVYASPSLFNVTIKDNNASNSGGLRCYNTSAKLNNVIISNNNANYAGGAYFISYSNAVLDNVIINNNTAEAGDGGGIAISHSEVIIKNSIIIGNQTTNDGAEGGGLKINANCDNTKLENVTIAHNISTNGGAIFSRTKNLSLTNVTISGNVAPNGGGIKCDGESSTNLLNTIFWNNTPPEIFLHTENDTITISYSDIQDGLDSIITNDGYNKDGMVNWLEGNINANPAFCDPLGYNFTLAQNSPCISTGHDGNNIGAYPVGCETIVNYTPEQFSLLEPPNDTQFTINETNMYIFNINFSWQTSLDANGDSLYYLMRATSSEIGEYTIDTNATAIDVSYMDIIEDMSENNVTAATLEWTVYVTDGIDTVEADNAPYTIGIDGTNALSAYLEGLIPYVFALHQNYPNPFNPVTSLRYDLPEQAQVILTVYDLMGREITQLVNTTQEAGYRSVQWNATDSFGKPVSAGVYLYQIRAGEFVQTKKMVLLK